MDNKTKQIILDRLFKTSSFCKFCGRTDCGHSGYRELHRAIDRDDVLKAINLDEWLFKEEE